jgi:hypothetical protein
LPPDTNTNLHHHPLLLRLDAWEKKKDERNEYVAEPFRQIVNSLTG